MHTILALDATDVLQRARSLLEAGPLVSYRLGDSAYCPWCAIAQAKSALDRECGTSGDSPLETARVWLGAQDNGVHLTQVQALARLDKAIAISTS